MVVLCEVLESWTSLTAVCINCEGARWACEELGCVFFWERNWVAFQLSTLITGQLQELRLKLWSLLRIC
jgi:hypothetical protein